MEEKIKKTIEERVISAIMCGIAGFCIGFFLFIFMGLPQLRIFPYSLREEKISAQFCFGVRSRDMTRQELIRCRDIEMRESFFRAGLTVAMLATIYGFINYKWFKNYKKLDYFQPL